MQPQKAYAQLFDSWYVLISGCQYLGIAKKHGVSLRPDMQFYRVSTLTDSILRIHTYPLSTLFMMNPRSVTDRLQNNQQAATGFTLN